MARFSITHTVNKAVKALERKRHALNSETHKAVKIEAFQTHRDLVRNTPKKWSGKTRKAWKVQNKSKGKHFVHYRVFNDSPVMRFLEKGTKTRRPRTARHLFIPLKQSAWRKGGYKRGMKFGRDFVFAKKAKGIKAIRLIPPQIKKTRSRLRSKLGRVAKHITVSG